VYFEETFESQRLPSRTIKAIDKWLGNIESIGHLREEVARALGNTTSILQTKFLYSGTHCGDVVGLELLDELLIEIALLRDRTEGLRSAYLPKFLEDVTDLIRAARTENNPIVFV
jgi:hypothetical protein